MRSKLYHRSVQNLVLVEKKLMLYLPCFIFYGSLANATLTVNVISDEASIASDVIPVQL